jgi:hypothetical protein
VTIIFSRKNLLHGVGLMETYCGIFVQIVEPEETSIVGNSTVTSRDPEFYMLSVPRSNSNMYVRNNRGNAGSAVFYAVRAKAT